MTHPDHTNDPAEVRFVLGAGAAIFAAEHAGRTIGDEPVVVFGAEFTCHPNGRCPIHGYAVAAPLSVAAAMVAGMESWVDASALEDAWSAALVDAREYVRRTSLEGSPS